MFEYSIHYLSDRIVGNLPEPAGGAIEKVEKFPKDWANRALKSTVPSSGNGGEHQKVLDEFKNKLGENKSWASTGHVKNCQARLL